MQSTAIVYVSLHHRNTEKLIKAMAQEVAIEAVTVAQAEKFDFSALTCVAFASGIYMGKFHQSIYTFIKKYRNKLPQHTFAVCSSGRGKGKYAKKFAGFLRENGFNVLGVFECKGFDTFGPLKLFGGLNKGHPNEKDIALGCAFMKNIMKDKL